MYWKTREIINQFSSHGLETEIILEYLELFSPLPCFLSESNLVKNYAHAHLLSLCLLGI